MKDLIELIDDEPTVTTLVIAEQDEMPEHASILRLLRDNLKDFNLFGRVGFEIRPFMTAGGEQRREFARLNERQATLLFTYMRNSEPVKQFKIRLVQEFYRMATLLKEKFDNMTPGEKLLHHAQALVRVEKKQAKLDEEMRRVAVESAETKAQVRALVDGEDYFTVVGYANLLGVPMPLHEAQRLGKEASAVCRENGWETGKAPHPIYGEVNTYPRQALKNLLH